LRNIEWDSLLEGNVETAWNRFKNNILSLAEANIPRITATSNGRPKPIWLTKKCLRAITKKQKTFEKYKDKRHPACVKANKAASKAVHRARRNFEKSLAEEIKLNKKLFFAYVRGKAKSSFRWSINKLIRTDSAEVEDNVEELNRFLYLYLQKRI